jgi:thymidylate synthase ThyX
LKNEKKEKDKEVQKETEEYAKAILEEYKADPQTLAKRFEEEFGIKVKK